jgi:repressor LexA
MLTRKQKDLLVLIRDRLAADGVPPSFDEMKDAIGLKSKSGIHRLIMGLEERGFIKRMPHRARALEIMRMPEGLDNKPAKMASRKMRAPEMPASLPSMGAIAAANAASVSLPMYGRIAAGTPIEALREFNTNIDVPAGLLASSRGKFVGGEHYALEVSGDSMIEAGIMDGDHVIIRKCDTAENGAIVVALVEDSEATLKYLEKRNGKVDLIPANKNYETRSFGPDQVKVQGKLVGLLRQY